MIVPYPTLPRGPPLATLAPTSIQLSNICKAFVNQTPAKLLSQLEILEIRLDLEKLRRFWEVRVFLMPGSDSNLIPKSLHNPKSHLKIQHLTSKSKTSKTKSDVCFDVFFCFKVIYFFTCSKMFLAKRSFLGYVGETQVMFCLMCSLNELYFLFNVVFQKSTHFLFKNHNSFSEICVTFQTICVTFQNPT